MLPMEYLPQPAVTPHTATATRTRRMNRTCMTNRSPCRWTRLLLGRSHGFPPHAHRDDADLFNAGAGCRVDDRHDFTVGDRLGADDEQRLVLACREELAELCLCLGDRRFLLVDSQPVVGGVVRYDLAKHVRS